MDNHPTRMRLALAAAAASLALGAGVARAESADATHQTRPDHFRVGALAAAGFPRPLSVEGMIELERVLGLGLEYGVLPKTTIAGVDVSMWSLAGDLRIFPFRGAFFIGLRGGLQHASGMTTLSIPVYGSVAESMTAETWFVNPRIGLLWTWNPGFTLGMDAGVQLPISSTVSSSLPAQLAGTQSVTSVTDVLSKTPLPTVDLLQIGVLF